PGCPALQDVKETVCVSVATGKEAGSRPADPRAVVVQRLDQHWSDGFAMGEAADGRDRLDRRLADVRRRIAQQIRNGYRAALAAVERDCDRGAHHRARIDGQATA